MVEVQQMCHGPEFHTTQCYDMASGLTSTKPSSNWGKLTGKWYSLGGG